MNLLRLAWGSPLLLCWLASGAHAQDDCSTATPISATGAYLWTNTGFTESDVDPDERCAGVRLLVRVHGRGSGQLASRHDREWLRHRHSGVDRNLRHVGLRRLRPQRCGRLRESSRSGEPDGRGGLSRSGRAGRVPRSAASAGDRSAQRGADADAAHEQYVHDARHDHGDRRGAVRMVRCGSDDLGLRRRRIPVRSSGGRPGSAQRLVLHVHRADRELVPHRHVRQRRGHRASGARRHRLRGDVPGLQRRCRRRRAGGELGAVARHDHR